MPKSFIKSPLNYTGGKFALLPKLISEFPGDMNTFVDLFAGGLNVGINVNAKHVLANDHITYLIEVFEYFKSTEIDELIKQIEERIKKFDLSQTNTNGYNALRDYYNSHKNPLDLFVLTCFSFNHQIRFNNSMKFNTPFGKNRSSYNANIKQNLIRFCERLQDIDISFSINDFRDMDLSKLTSKDVVYCDPPYLITTGSYNDGKRGFGDWTLDEEQALLLLLDDLSSKGVRFFLSNVLYHKGQSNDVLIEWSKKYRTIFLDKNYSNCSYHLKDRNQETVEVLITNYVK